MDLLNPGEAKDAVAAAELRRRLGEEWLAWADRWGQSQRRVLTSDKQYLIALGGNGAGKTQLGGYWAKIQLDSFNPVTGKVIPRQHPVQMYCVGPTTEKLEGVMKPSLEKWFPKGTIISRGSREVDIWKLTEGRKIFWKTGKQDPMSFSGDEIDAAWIDEEIATEEHWKRVLSRGFRRLCKVLCSMTAENGTLWFHSWIFNPDVYPMEEKEIVSIDTRENPYYSDCDVCSKPMRWHDEGRKGTCPKFDNSKGQLKLALRIRQVGGVGSKDFDVRIRGLYLIGAGAAVIDPVRRMKMEEQFRRDPVVGYLNENLKFVKADKTLGDDSRWWLRVEVARRVHESGKEHLYMLTPVRGRQYVIGVDAAEGNPTGDYHAAVVIDQENGEQCALAHSRAVSAREFGAFVCQLARWYNDAYVVVESNNHGQSIVDALIGLNYGNLYRRQRLEGIGKPPTKLIGFWTNNKTKKPAVDMMAQFFVDRMRIHDPIIYGEAYAYTWLAENRFGQHGVGNANPSGHDDTMTALFCASVGLRQMGWATTRPEDSPQREYNKTVEDALFEDASGRTMSEEEMLEKLSQEDEDARSVSDVFAQAEPEEWIP